MHMAMVEFFGSCVAHIHYFYIEREVEACKRVVAVYSHFAVANFYYHNRLFTVVGRCTELHSGRYFLLAKKVLWNGLNKAIVAFAVGFSSSNYSTELSA